MSTRVNRRDNKPVILLVDDTPANLNVLCDLLDGSGFEVRVAEDGASAVEQVSYARPDLILLDVRMPGMDGFETCRILQERVATRDIPIIFMTALTDTADKIKGFQCGAVDYITKPFQHEEVLARVATHIKLQNLTVKLKESEERLSRIFQCAMDAIITTDQDGCISMFNRAAEEMFCCVAAQAIGRPVAGFLSDDLARVIADYMKPALGQAPQSAMWVPEGLTAVRATGEPFSIEATVSRADAVGQTFYTLILRDIHERNKLQSLARYLQNEVHAARGIGDLVGSSPALTQVMRDVQQVAATDTTVLITGETGTGKELIARALHTLSARKDKAMVTLNCAAIAAGIMESELFGHEKGAFTGAQSRKIGRFELADGGTIFLDEIGELAPDLQAKLLRVLEQGEFERVGSAHTFKVDVRVIAATHRDLEQRCRSGEFRSDLYYRLNVFPIHLPPLRERREDIPLLVEHFVQKYANKLGKHISSMPAQMMAALQAYAWPGNVRELQHVIERAAVLTSGSELAFGDWFHLSTAGPESAQLATLDEAERAHIIKVLESVDWRISGDHGAAVLLGVPSTTLRSRMERLGVQKPR
ncbi:MAG: sigma-54-dependent Fis family transcriptional regulator [Nitrococcus sp.]|nr:sigma-54-dependent Fis family transcriptional regulator [Nitrococcus sp.]